MVSLDPAATALVEGMGLAARVVEAEGVQPPSLWLLAPSAPLPRDLAADALVLRMDRERLDGVFSAARRIGAALDARDEASRWIDATQLDLARISASSLGMRRPHVAVLLGADPLTVAGGASLETELIEIAGAESVTHGGDEVRVGFDRIPDEHRTPDLWLWIAERRPSARDLSAAAARLPTGAQLDAFALPVDWLADPIAHAKRLRARVAAIPAPDAGNY